MTKDDPSRTMRLHRFLAKAGVDSRRKCEVLIAEGRVSVDGETVTGMGVKVDSLSNVVRLDGVVVQPTVRVHYVLHKPRGYICTNDPAKAPMRAVDLVPAGFRLFTAGRLDVNSEGLVIITNDGDFAQQLTHPRYGVEKTYRVKVDGAVPDRILARMRTGVPLRDGEVLPSQVRRADSGKGWTEIDVSVYEGVNHEVRRLFARFGIEVRRLLRLAVGPFYLGDLPSGHWRRLPLERANAFLARKGGRGG
jgi:23S rRNA pseudouridine2605 synthase